MNEPRNCKRCDGTGTAERETWTGTQWVPGPCKACGGTGTLATPDFKLIFQDVTRKVKGKLAFRRSKPTRDEFKNRHSSHVYYVWRMARFHGGADVTMPVVAGLATAWDPWTEELDALASLVAKLFFGTHMAGAVRWARALGREVPADVGPLPITAETGMPVCLGDKPIEEYMELH